LAELDVIKDIESKILEERFPMGNGCRHDPKIVEDWNIVRCLMGLQELIIIERNISINLNLVCMISSIQENDLLTVEDEKYEKTVFMHFENEMNISNMDSSL
jgi:hypothetical protein